METTVLGINIKAFCVILLVLLVILLIFLIAIINKLNIMARKYEALMSGKKGADLEKIIRVRFKEMDQVKANAKRVTKEHKEIKRTLKSCYSKLGIVKYDAFEQMAGKLSFVIALLNEDNSGFVFNSMHSREGCFNYAKEIIKGESYIPLSDEEKEAIEKAKTVEEEIDDLTNDADNDLNFEFDIPIDDTIINRAYVQNENVPSEDNNEVEIDVHNI
ncbi:MAG: DUF4446 family protein [Lachnospiraceae bacterium]|nr:DUF4446 family protein [Lachnospiraceae bacterium]